METTAEKLKEITAVENKYGLMPFRMGLTHLVDVGVRHLDDENVEESIQHVMLQGELDRANGVLTVMTPEFQCDIIRCAAELATFSIWDLFAYIKECGVVGPEKQQESDACPECGSGDLEHESGAVVDSNYIYKWTCGECGTRGHACYDMVFSEHVIDWKGEQHGEIS